MYSYTLGVLSECADGLNVFTLISPHKLDERVLQIIGMYLDNAMMNENLQDALTTAQMYVKVIGETEKQEWVDKVINEKVQND